MNPSKMRDTYGKLMYILMDTESYHVKTELKLNFIKPILTVSSFLDAKRSLDILADPLWTTATRSISNASGDKTKKELALEVSQKAAAEAALRKKYASGTLVCVLKYIHASHLQLLCCSKVEFELFAVRVEMTWVYLISVRCMCAIPVDGY